MSRVNDVHSFVNGNKQGVAKYPFVFLSFDLHIFLQFNWTSRKVNLSKTRLTCVIGCFVVEWKLSNRENWITWCDRIDYLGDIRIGIFGLVIQFVFSPTSKKMLFFVVVFQATNVGLVSSCSSETCEPWQNGFLRLWATSLSSFSSSSDAIPQCVVYSGQKRNHMQYFTWMKVTLKISVIFSLFTFVLEETDSRAISTNVRSS